MIVVDTNILAYLYLPGEHTVAAEALLEADPEWAAPVLWRSEFRNVLAGCIRRGLLRYEQALRLLDEAEDLMRGAEYEVASPAVLELVRDSDCSAYDCEFIALATALKVPLVTMDAGLLRAFPRVARSLMASALSRRRP